MRIADLRGFKDDIVFETFSWDPQSIMSCQSLSAKRAMKALTQLNYS
jgi:hypothetical protein